MRIAFPICLAAFALVGCSTLETIPTEKVGDVRLSFANGLPAGTGQLVSDGRTLSLVIAMTGLEPGEHGFHLHTTGKCTAPDFQSAGGHLNPAGREHGSLNPRGKHLGDLPNLVIGASRSASTEVDLGADTRELRETLFDDDGTALVVHAAADDYRSDPAGDAGSRVACGVLRQSS